jgi:hypothetical protein
MNIQRVKQGAKITMYNGIYMVVFGFYYIFFYKMNMASNFEAISSLWVLFVKYNPEIADLFILFNIGIGIFLVSI